MKFYHISPIKNRESILINGLIPQCGERSIRFNQMQSRIYVLDKIWKLHRLMQCNLWKTHPDFKDGFDIYEIESDLSLFKNDEKFQYGLYCQTSLKNIKLITTIFI